MRYLASAEGIALAAIVGVCLCGFIGFGLFIKRARIETLRRCGIIAKDGGAL